MPTIRRLFRSCIIGFVIMGTTPAFSQAPDLKNLIRGLTAEDPDQRIAAVYSISLSGHPLAKEILEGLAEEGLLISEDLGKIFVTTAGSSFNLSTGQRVSSVPSGLESVMINNAMRSAIDLAKAAVALSSQNASIRRQAAKSLQNSEDESLQLILEQALKKESDPAVAQELRVTIAMLHLQFGKGSQRIDAVSLLGQSDQSRVQQRLASLLRKEPNGEFTEPDLELRRSAEIALKQIESRLAKFEILTNLFSGLSLGSILLLAALGLAITYGLMGVINMAHGEFLMIGAYVTYVTQGIFRLYFPDAFGFYLLASLPAAFLITGLIGIALERSVLRWLYGRPLETLLTTWGVSLLLMQLCRTIFGAQNVEVENPSWLSGGISLAGDMTLPWNRIIIIGFSIVVLISVAILISKTRAGLYIRGVTQNRAMASCTGVATDRVDMLTFGFGSGIAGLGGVALSQIGNVGPDLGQQYIVDSFMVVVLGGVGQLAGTVIAALGLGSVTKLLEPWSGAVLAKIAVLIFIIVFIQKRPQGLFALKGRSAEA